MFFESKDARELLRSAAVVAQGAVDQALGSGQRLGGLVGAGGAIGAMAQEASHALHAVIHGLALAQGAEAGQRCRCSRRTQPGYARSCHLP